MTFGKDAEILSGLEYYDSSSPQSKIRYCTRLA